MKKLVKLKVILLAFIIIFTSKSLSADLILPLPKPAVDQEIKVEELAEVVFDSKLKDEIPCDKDLHTMYRSCLGQVNWLQSRTQYQSTYAFSRCASAAASPTIGDVRSLNRLVRKIRAEVIMLKFWPQKGKTRIVGYPDAAYQNNRPDFSTQRGHCIFICENTGSILNN